MELDQAAGVLDSVAEHVRIHATSLIDLCRGELHYMHTVSLARTNSAPVVVAAGTIQCHIVFTLEAAADANAC